MFIKIDALRHAICPLEPPGQAERAPGEPGLRHPQQQGSGAEEPEAPQGSGAEAGPLASAA